MMKFKSPSPLLMIIDLQKAIDDPSWGTRNNPEAEAQIGRLLSTWRQLGLPILHVKHMSTDPNSRYFPNTLGNAFKDIAIPLENEQILEKGTNSAFIHTDLHSMLQRQGITEIVMVGVITNNSVEATARMSGNLGYETIVVSDGTFTFNRTDFGGREHDAKVVHDMALSNLEGEYAMILSTEEVLNCAGNSKEYLKNDTRA